MKRIPKTVALALTALILSSLIPTVPTATAPPPVPGKASAAEASAKAPNPAAKEKKARKAPRASKASFEGKISINAASAKDFERLPRVGAKLAQRIVDYRDQHKSFKTVDELRNVKGVGAKMLEALKPHLTL